MGGRLKLNLAKIRNYKVSLKTLILAVILVGTLCFGTASYVFSQNTQQLIFVESGSFTETLSYVIENRSSIIYAKNGTTGEIEFNGTDASQVINCAISTLASKGGGSILFRAGKYALSSSIIIKDKISLIGEMESKVGSAVTIFTRADGFTGDMLKTEVVYVDALEKNTQDIKIKNLIFNGGNVGTCLNLTNVDTAVIEEVRVAYCDTAIYLGYYGDQTNDAVYPGDIRIIKCRIDADTYGIYMERNLGDMISQTKISSAEYALYVKCCKILHITENSFYNFGTCAIKLVDDSNEHLESIIICNNRFYTTHSAMYIDIDKTHASTSRILINDNVFSYSALDRPNTFDFASGIQYSSFRGNTGYHAMSEQSGVETFSGTSYTFYHNLAKAPTLVVASFNSTSYGGYTWTATDTQITITVQNTGSYTVYWYAEYNPFS